MNHISRLTYVVKKCCVNFNPMTFYAVAHGRRPGIFYTWRECEASVSGYGGAQYKKFQCECEAMAYLSAAGVRTPYSKKFCKSPNDDSDIEIVEADPNGRLPTTELSEFLLKSRTQDGMATPALLAGTLSKKVKSTPQASESNMDNSSHSFDFASFEQRLTNLENLYQLKIRTLEERVEALEAMEGAKALVESGDFDDNTCDNTSVSTMDPAPGTSAAVSNTNDGLLSNVPPNPMSTLRRKFHVLASNPIPLGRKSIVSRESTRKRAGGISSVCEEPPYKISAVPPLDGLLAGLDELSGVPFRVDSKGYIEVYTDGACTNNGRNKAKAGIGVWFNDGHPLNVSEPVKGRATNNTAEIQAAKRAVEQAALHGVKKLCVFTDSSFTINCITKWMSKWQVNNWKTHTGEAVKNKEDLIELHKACNQLGTIVKWTHVPGHNGVHGNECADRLAKAGADNYRV